MALQASLIEEDSLVQIQDVDHSEQGVQSIVELEKRDTNDAVF